MESRYNRILTLDVTRGIALFGILMVNMMSFHSPYLYINPQKWWTTPYDHYAYNLIDLFFKSSFYPLFSLLFGYSLEIFRERAIEKALSFQRMALRRFCFLFIIGFIHAFFIWHGDILMVYAVIGLFTLPFLKIPPKILFMFGSFLYLIANTLFVLFLAVMDYYKFGMSENSVNSNLGKTVVHIYQHGSFGEITRQRVQDWITEYNPQAIILLFFTIFPLFLIGAGLSKLKVHEKVVGYESKWKRIFLWTFLFGALFKLLPYLVGNYRGVAYLHDVFGGSLQAVSYASIIVLMLRQKSNILLLKIFSFVGKMSLTNYLLQSIFWTMIFYGYGLQFYGKITLFGGCLLVFPFFIFQITFSFIWLRRHHYGPFEWVWRSITYWRVMG